MTSETRHLVQMADMRGLEIMCDNKKCAARLVVSFASTDPIPGACPLCREPLFDPKTADWESTKQLRSAIFDLANRNVTNIRLEFVGMKP